MSLPSIHPIRPNGEALTQSSFAFPSLVGVDGLLYLVHCGL